MPAGPDQDVPVPGPEAQIADADADGWKLDLDFGDSSELLAALRIDGEAVATPEEFRARMATAKSVESLGQEIRILHGEEFVMELASDSAVRLDDWMAQPGGGESQILRVERGGIRVATGPAFSALTVETAQVRTEVLGTIFGVDVGKDVAGTGYTCVCCYRGTVKTTPMLPLEGVPIEGRLASLQVGSQRTRVLRGDDSLEDALPLEQPLVKGHREPLERLSTYWG